MQVTKNAACLLLMLSVCAAAIAQTPPNEKPKLKHFGSSLDRLKWDKDKQAAVEKSSPAKALDNDEDVIRVDAQLIASDVLVVGRQGPVSNLTKDDFVITEDGQPQTIGHFSVGSDPKVPKTIVLIIDYSGSELPYLGKSIAAAKVLIDHLGPNDRMAIVTDDVEMLIGFTNDKQKLKHKLDDLLAWIRPGHLGKSRQFSALMATVRELISNEDIRPIIIFQTDGDERSFMRPALDPKNLPPTFRNFGIPDVLSALEKSRATVYTVIPNIRLIGVPPEEFPERAEKILDLEVSPFGFKISHTKKEAIRYAEVFFLPCQRAAAEVATATGGWTAFLEHPEQADDIYRGILADVNSRYVVGYYYPADRPRDGKRHTFSIAVKNHPEYQIQGRKSYIAQQANQ